MFKNNKSLDNILIRAAQKQTRLTIYLQDTNYWEHVHYYNRNTGDNDDGCIHTPMIFHSVSTN
jgi:hypothetical protein